MLHLRVLIYFYSQIVLNMQFQPPLGQTQKSRVRGVVKYINIYIYIHIYIYIYRFIVIHDGKTDRGYVEVGSLRHI